MDTEEFKDFAQSMAEFIGNYLDNIRERRVLPEVEPGYLRPLLPETAPEDGERWQALMGDLERVIMPGVTHWHHPQFHGYYPTAQSYPAIVADMLSGGIACIGISWITSPACTELEMVVLDWLGKMIDLPVEFLSCSNGKGGGVIQSTASESTLIALLSAKAKYLSRAKELEPDQPEGVLTSKLVGYCSDLAHTSVNRAGLLGGIKMRGVAAGDDYRLRGEALRKAIREDKEAGRIPFFAVATLGTTVNCAFDDLDEIGTVCVEEDLWLHVDAAYAGAAFICPEFRHLMRGIEKADTFNFNPHKWMLVNFDSAAMWFKDASYMINTYGNDPVYLKHEHQGVPDYRHWQIPFGRRFRSLKLWFVLRIYGVKGLQAHIRKQVALAKQFEGLVLQDNRFELFCPASMGLVCFRLKGSNETNELLLKKINANGKIYMVPSKIKETYFLRMVVCSRFCQPTDMELAFNEVSSIASELQ
ncbi:aromatic-L-amino-acid decarboxylase-like [Neocloeon triangulifer]|uniref:aromatic-L-amino-acid decarboxylase-like n=1 Tax=Neocloeon triangulifer TaxID=2078957 RepID=UPI00286F535A|nr:aromatic-L-amino-acid decarboxylase-like [Neocloeon triangulifer]XP_059479854.1 aromatic-L-amino-acid decarboxylase-like [Neocloeon triangulifer]